MPRKKLTFDAVRTIGLALPGVEDGTAYGTPALKVHGRMFACVPSHPSAEADSVAIRIDVEQRDDLVREDPATYYLPDHYVNYPIVLVRLTRVHPEALSDLLRTGWRFVSERSRKPVRRPRAPRR